MVLVTSSPYEKMTQSREEQRQLNLFLATLKPSFTDSVCGKNDSKRRKASPPTLFLKDDLVMSQSAYRKELPSALTGIFPVLCKRKWGPCNLRIGYSPGSVLFSRTSLQQWVSKSPIQWAGGTAVLPGTAVQ